MTRLEETVLPIEEQSEQVTADAPRAGQLLTGDLGLVVLRALLENGVGYVVSSWQDRPTPIDAAIDDARARILVPRGVVLRRLRSLSALEPIISAPTGGITGAPPRGGVVFAGRRGLRPALEQFVRTQASGAVVGFTFDEDALRIEGAIVIDPEPTGIGLVRAVDDAFAASLATGRPALIVLRERALGMRGTIRRRADRSPVEAAEADVQLRANGFASADAAAERVGLLHASIGSGRGPRIALLVSGPLRIATERAIAQVGELLLAAGSPVVTDDLLLVSSRVAGLTPDPAGPIGQALASATEASIIAPRAARLAERLRERHGCPVRIAHDVDAGTVRGEDIVSLLAGWVAELLDPEDPAQASLVALTGASPGLDLHRVRMPRRGEVLHRSVSSVVAAGLTLAQGVIGVPGRLDVAYPTYQTDTGVPLSIVPGPVFAEHGIASAAPGSAAGAFLVTGPTGGVAEAAGAAGASIEFVDGSSPRAIGVAVATACRSTRTAPHVIIVNDVQRIAAPNGATFGMDPDLVGTERLATAAVPAAATALVDLGDDLLAGPAVLALDRPEARASLDAVRDLSPATWDLRRRPAAGRGGRASWNLRRRVIRTIGGVDL